MTLDYIMTIVAMVCILCCVGCFSLLLMSKMKLNIDEVGNVCCAQVICGVR